MAITLRKDKEAIQTIIGADALMITLGFTAAEIHLHKQNDSIINPKLLQVFIYNAPEERTRNDIEKGIAYEITLSGPSAKSGSVDYGSDQIIALLHNKVLHGSHRLELLDAPITLASQNSLYQMATKFVCYETVYNNVRTSI